MKLILESWRHYLTESEKSTHYGVLYLFEGDNVRETSFYDAINTLSESDDDIEIFLENWEKSIDYIFSQLDEQGAAAAINKAYMDATLQGYEVLVRAKDKAFAPIIKLSDKLKKFSEKNPKTAKTIKLTGGALLLAAAATKIVAIIQVGGDARAIEQIAQAAASIDPGVGQEVQEVAQNFTPEAVIDFAEEAKQVVSQTADTLAKTDDPGLQQIAQASEQVSQGADNPFDTLEQMMMDRTAEPAEQGGAESYIGGHSSLDNETLDQEIRRIGFDPGEPPGFLSDGVDGLIRTQENIEKLQVKIDAGEFDGLKGRRELFKALEETFGDDKDSRKLVRQLATKHRGNKLIDLLYKSPYGRIMKLVDKTVTK